MPEPVSYKEVKSLPAWGVRVEIGQMKRIGVGVESLPAWGVRVEIRRAAGSSS